MRRRAFGTHMVCLETFLRIQLRLLQLLIRRDWIHGVLIYQNKFTHHRRRRVRTKHLFRIRDASQDRQPKIQSSLVMEDSQRIMWQTNNGKFTTPAAFALLEKKIRDTEECTCSQFPTEAMLWIKEVQNGWISGWSRIFVINERCSNAKIWSTRCEDCLSTEQNNP